VRVIHPVKHAWDNSRFRRNENRKKVQKWAKGIDKI
jgi:hypothetical protein